MLKKFVGNSTLYLLATLLNRGIAFLLLPIYTSFLLPADYGIIAVCASIYGILPPLLTLNLNSALGLLYYKLDEQEYKKLLSAVWFWYLIIPLLLVGIFEIFGATVAGKFFPSIAWHPYLRLAVWISYLSVAQQLPLVIFEVEQKAAKYAVMTTAFFLITSSSLIYFIAIRQTGAEGSLQGQAIGLIIVSLVSHVIVVRRLFPLRQVTFSWTYLTKAIRLCAPTVPYSFCFWAMNLSDRWVLGYFVSTAEIGIYNLASNIGIIVSVMGVALSSAFTPVYYQQYKEQLFRERLPTLLSLYLLAMTLITLAISLLSPEILKIMASPAYYEAWKFVPLIAGGYWAYAGIYLLSLSVIQNAGKTKWIVVLTAPPAAINFILNWYLVPRYGIWAAAATTLLAFLLMAAAAHTVAKQMDKLPYRWTFLLYTLAVAVCTYLIGTFWLFSENLTIAIFTKGVLLIVAAGLMLIGSGLDFRQIATLYANFRSKKSAT